MNRPRLATFALIVALTAGALAEQRISDPARRALDVRLAASSEHALLVWRSYQPTELTGVLLDGRAEQAGEPFPIASNFDLREIAVAASDRDYLVVWQNFGERRLEAAVIDPAAPQPAPVTLSSSLQIVVPAGRPVYAFSPPPRAIWNGTQYVVFWVAVDGLLHAATLDPQLKIDREVVMPLDRPPLALASQGHGDTLMVVSQAAADRVTLSAAILDDHLELAPFQPIATATPLAVPAYDGPFSSAAAIASESGYAISWIRKQDGAPDTIELTATAANGMSLNTTLGADANVHGKVVGHADAEAQGLHMQRSADLLSVSWSRRDTESAEHHDMPHLGGFIVWLHERTLQARGAQTRVLPSIDAAAFATVGEQTIAAYIPRGNVLQSGYPPTTVYATTVNHTPRRRRAVR